MRLARRPTARLEPVSKLIKQAKSSGLLLRRVMFEPSKLAGATPQERVDKLATVIARLPASVDRPCQPAVHMEMPPGPEFEQWRQQIEELPLLAYTEECNAKMQPWEQQVEREQKGRQAERDVQQKQLAAAWSAQLFEAMAETQRGCAGAVPAFLAAYPQPPVPPPLPPRPTMCPLLTVYGDGLREVEGQAQRFAYRWTLALDATNRGAPALVWLEPVATQELPLASWMPAELCHGQPAAAAEGQQLLGWTWLANVGLGRANYLVK